MKQTSFTPRPCSYCGLNMHTSLQCFDKPRRPLRKASTKTVAKSAEVRRAWFLANPANDKGIWDCYLRISPSCQRGVTSSTIELDHKDSRSRHPELKHEVTNLFASCHPCNSLKGSLSITDLMVKYPHVTHLKELL